MLCSITRDSKRHTTSGIEQRLANKIECHVRRRACRTKRTWSKKRNRIASQKQTRRTHSRHTGCTRRYHAQRRPESVTGRAATGGVTRNRPAGARSARMVGQSSTSTKRPTKCYGRQPVSRGEAQQHWQHGCGVVPRWYRRWRRGRGKGWWPPRDRGFTDSGCRWQEQFMTDW